MIDNKEEKDKVEMINNKEDKDKVEMVDKVINPCGTYCNECDDFGTVCDGCRNRNGRPIWYKLYNLTEQCMYFKCCEENKVHDCSACSKVPCNKHFIFPDPGMSNEDKEKWLELRIKNLMGVNKKLNVELTNNYEINEKRYNI